MRVRVSYRTKQSANARASPADRWGFSPPKHREKKVAFTMAPSSVPDSIWLLTSATALSSAARQSCIACTWAVYSALMVVGTGPPLNTRSTTALLCCVAPESRDSRNATTRISGTKIAATAYPIRFLVCSSLRSSAAFAARIAGPAIEGHLLSFHRSRAVPPGQRHPAAPAAPDRMR